MPSTLTRRALGRLLGATAGAALLDSRFPATLSAAPSANRVRRTDPPERQRESVRPLRREVSRR